MAADRRDAVAELVVLASSFLGYWTAETGGARTTCAGDDAPAASSFSSSLEIGQLNDHQLSIKVGGCGDTPLTFDVSGNLASLAPAPQTCPDIGSLSSFTLELSLPDGQLVLTQHVIGELTLDAAACSLVVEQTFTHWDPP